MKVIPLTAEEEAQLIEDSCSHGSTANEPIDLNDPKQWCVCICLACYKEIVNKMLAYMEEALKVSENWEGPAYIPIKNALRDLRQLAGKND